MVSLALAALLAGAAIQPNELVQVADLSGLSVSPDGRWLAYRVQRPCVVTNRIETAWYVLPVAGGMPRKLADAGEALLNGAGVAEEEVPIWTVDSGSFVVRAAIDGQVQLWRVALDGDAAPLTAEPGDVSMAVIDPATGALAYRTGEPRARLNDLDRQSREKGVVVGPDVDLAIGAGSGGRYLGQEVPVRITGRWFERVPRSTPVGPVRLWSPPAGQARVTFARPAGTLPIAPALETRLCGKDRCSGDRLIAALAIGDALLVTRQAESGVQSLWRYAQGGTGRLLYRSRGTLGGGRMPVPACATGSRRVFCVEAEADQPPRLVAIDLESGRAELLHDPNAELRTRTSGRAEPLRLQAGQATASAYLIPARAGVRSGPAPLVITYYRCDGFLRGGVGDELPIWSLADAGIAVLCINRAPFDIDAKTKIAELETAQRLVAAAIAQLADRQLVDPARVGMHGLSFGSEVVCWIASHSRLLAAAAIATGQLEPAFYWYYALPGRDGAEILRRFWGLGDPASTSERWAKIAPAKRAAQIRTPLLMQLPELEARWSLELFTRLKQLERPVEMVVFPGAAHIKSEPRQKVAAYRRNLDWFRFWLAGEQDPSPESTAQYARWRELRAAPAQPPMLPTQSSASASSSSRK